MFIAFGTVTEVPEDITEARCRDCGWKGDPEELLSSFWEHYQYCPKCESDETELIDLEFNNETLQYEEVQL